MKANPVSIPDIPGIAGTVMVKQSTTVERKMDKRRETKDVSPVVHRPPSGVPGTFVYRSASSVAEAQVKDDGALEATLVRDMLISEPLTRREMQIMKSIVAGQTNKQMARTLCRSQRTVEYHRNRLMRKLNAHNSAELVRLAIAMGIV